MKDVVFMTAEAWNDLPPLTLTRSWNKLLSTVDSTEDLPQLKVIRLLLLWSVKILHMPCCKHADLFEVREHQSGCCRQAGELDLWCIQQS